LVLTFIGGQQASEEVDSVLQHESDGTGIEVQHSWAATGAGAQHADSGSWLKLISLVTISPIDNLRFID
jgi:hypothetical protein